MSLNEIINKDFLEKLYFYLGSLKAVAKKLQIDPGTVKKYLINFGIELKKQIRYNCNHSFFSQINEKSLYIAGFISADGCIKDRKGSSGNIRPELAISLSSRDKNFLEMLRNMMSAEVPIRDYLVKNSNRNNKWNDSWRSDLVITSKQMCEDLRIFNISPRKTMNYSFPKWLIEHDLCHHFIRGYFDGDGSFYFPKLEKQIYFSMRGTKDFLKTVRDIFEKQCLLNQRLTDIRISSGQGILEYGGNVIVPKIANYLYNNATVFLPRKYFLVQHLLQKNSQSFPIM